MKSNADKPNGTTAPVRTAVSKLSESERVRRGRYNRPFTPEIADSIAEDRKDVFFGNLAARLLVHLRHRVHHDMERYVPRSRLSWANLSRQTGIPYRTIKRYCIEQLTPMPVAVLDALLWASKTSLLDLFTPMEIASYVSTMDHNAVEQLRASIKKTLDIGGEKAETQVSDDSTGSQ